MTLNDRDHRDAEERRLDLRKLQLEINDLRFGWLKTMATAVVTALVTVAVALLTLHGQAQHDRDDEVRAAEQTQANRFYAAQDGLAARSASSRTNAVIELGAYLHAPTLTNDSFVSPASALAALNRQLLSEDDPGVLATLATVIADAGSTALPSTLRINRYAARNLAAAYGVYVASHRYSDAAAFACGAAPLDSSVTSTVRPLEESLQTEFESFYLGCLIHEGSIQSAYYSGLRQKSAGVAEDTKVVADVAHWAGVLLASSNAIQQIVTRTAQSKIDLDGAMLYDVNLDGAHFVNSNLSGMYADGHGDRVDFDGANLTKAEFQNLILTNSTARNANVYCAYFEALEKHNSQGKIVGSTVDFTGSNWWTSTEYPDYYARPVWLSKYYGLTAADKVASCRR